VLPLTADELRIAAFAMGAAYGWMALGAFVPATKLRAAEGSPVRASRHVPTTIDRLWVGTQGLVLLLLLAAFVAPQALLDWPLSFRPSLGLFTALLGVAVFIGGCALIASAARTLGAELTVAIETREGGRLVTTGPYARVRHPIYTGVFLLVIGEAVALGSPVLAGYLVVAVVCARTRALAEEALLGSDPVHGAAYGAYQARTGRFLPKWGRPGA
jgi:protein-S-isoprenylcysteine O-methyltransferase Ste14